MDLEESEIEEQELEFEARFDYENDIDPNKLDLNGKRVKVPVSYYGPDHRYACQAAVLKKPGVLAFVWRAYEVRQKKIVVQDFRSATETVDGVQAMVPVYQKKPNQLGQ